MVGMGVLQERNYRVGKLDLVNNIILALFCVKENWLQRRLSLILTKCQDGLNDLGQCWSN